MTFGTCICQVGPYFCTNLGVHNFSTPLAMDSFMHAKSRIHATFLSSYTSSNPVTTFFIFSINSSLSPFHALHLIKKCFTSSISPLSHYVHFLSSVFKPVHLPPPLAALLHPLHQYSSHLLSPHSHISSFKSPSNQLF